MTFALDTETTGTDFKFGASPFFVTICHNDGHQTYYEWDVDPITRKVLYNREDLLEIKNLIQQVSNWSTMNEEVASRHRIVGQNLRFDINALSSIPHWGIEWPWKQTEDTLIASHVLCSILRHDLTSLGVQYLGVDIKPYEDAIQECTTKARMYVRRNYPEWMIAKEGLRIMPSVTQGKKQSNSGDNDKVWKNDMWLPRTVAKLEEYPVPDSDCPHEWKKAPSFTCELCGGHRWWVSLSEYSNKDSELTIALWNVMETKLKREGLWEIYRAQMKQVPVLYSMGQRGVTYSGEKLESLEKEYTEDSDTLNRVCVNLAKDKGHKITLPKNGRNDSLNAFIFNGMKLKSDKLTDSGNPSMDKHVLEHWSNSLPPGSKELCFIRSLIEKRAKDTALSFISAYKRFKRSIPDMPGWYRMYPNMKQTGTGTLRMSCENPNNQQISKQGKSNLRLMFGPAPGREWWSLDAQNIELRIPSYMSGEEKLIHVFDRPKEPPYYGSYHLAVFDALHPHLFAQHGKECKTLFEDTWYQWVKNGNFAVLYGCQKKKADETYHLIGAYDIVRYRFPKIAKLNDDKVKMADKFGYVETVPDKSVNPNKGYPVWCSRSDYGKVSPTVPLNYFVQSTASWWMRQAMVKVHEYLEDVSKQKGKPYYITMTVHDELDLDFPRGEGSEPWKTNLPIIQEVQRLMESCGDDIGIPTPVSVEYHSETWAVGMSV